MPRITVHGGASNAGDPLEELAKERQAEQDRQNIRNREEHLRQREVALAAERPQEAATEPDAQQPDDGPAAA